MKKMVLCFVLVPMLLTMTVSASMAWEYKRVVANITTNDVNRAVMAIQFVSAIMKKRQMPATLFFNIYGVELVNKRRPSPIYPTGMTVPQLLEEFRKAGGTLLACPLCMKNVGGMTRADLLPGVQAQEGGGVEAVTQPDTLVMTY